MAPIKQDILASQSIGYATAPLVATYTFQYVVLSLRYQVFVRVTCSQDRLLQEYF